jgi:hypothetical protein
VTRADLYREVAAKLRATGEHGSEHAALLVEQLADELESSSELPQEYPRRTPALPDVGRGERVG